MGYPHIHTWSPAHPSPQVGSLCMVTGGHNCGRVGTITKREKHGGSFEIVHVEDAAKVGA